MRSARETAEWISFLPLRRVLLSENSAVIVYALLADCLVVIHLAYISFVIFGQLAIMIGWPLGWRWIRNPWFRISHLAMILIVAVEAMADYECPFTTWERNLRISAGQIPADFATRPEWQERDLSFIGGLLRRVM